jgi:hypothetical protein
MTGARAELARTRKPGPELAHLLYRTVSIIAVSRNFPPPAGSACWDDSAVTETAHDLIDGPRGYKRLADALLRSSDEQSFARQLEGATVNFLRDIARATDMGKVVVRVTEVLKKNDEFAPRGGRPPRWGLADGPAQPSATSPSDLARAAATELDVVVPAWRSERRDPPIADNASLVRILTRVLTAAQGGLTAAEAAAAVAARIEVRRSPLTVELGVMERIAERASTPDPAIATVVSVAAASLFSDLDDRERILLAGFHLSLESAADQLVLRRSQTAELRQRVVRRMQAALGIQFDKEGKPIGGDEEAVLTAALVRDLCAAWAEGRT